MEPSWGRPTPSRVSLEGFLGSVWPLVGSPEALVEPSQAENATSTEKLPGFRNLGDDSDRSRVLLGFIGAVWGRSGGLPWAIGLPSGTTGWCPQASGRARRIPEGFRAPGAKPGHNEGHIPTTHLASQLIHDGPIPLASFTVLSLPLVTRPRLFHVSMPAPVSNNFPSSHALNGR